MRNVAGKKLLNYMYDNKISGKDMAVKIGTSQAQLSKYVNGYSSPRIHIAFRIKEATNGHIKLIDWITTKISEEEE